MPDPVTLSACMSIPWKSILALLSIYTMVFGSLTSYILFCEYSNVWTSLAVSSVASFVFTFGLYCSSVFRCSLVVACIMCFTKMGLGLVYLFLSWMVLSGRLYLLITNLLRIEDHTKCIASTYNSTLVSTELDWHVSQIQLATSVIHYGFFLPILLLVIYSFTYVFCYRVSETSSSSSDVNKVNFIKSVIICVKKGGQLLLGFTAGATTVTIYFSGVASLLSAFEVQLGRVKCAFSVDPMSWTILYVYLAIGLTFLLISNFSGYAYRYREATVKRYFPVSAGDRTNIPANIVEPVRPSATDFNSTRVPVPHDMDTLFD